MRESLSCCLVVELKTREFHSRLKIACDLALRGVPALIGTRAALYGVMGEHVPYILLDKSATTPELPVYKRIVRSGGAFMVLDEEGGVLIQNDDSVLLARHPKECLDLADFVLVWGKMQKRSLVKGLGINEEKVLVCGNPRFNLIGPRFASLSHHGAKILRERYGEYILCCSNFVFGNLIYGEKDSITLFNNVLNFQDKNRIAKMIETNSTNNQQIRDLFIPAIRRLSEAFPERKIIFRPHPAEKDVVYREGFRSCPNVHVIFEGEIKDWVAGCSLLIHHSCTTGIEGVLAGKPVIAYVPVNDPKVNSQLPISVSISESEQGALVSRVRGILNGEEEGSIVKASPLLKPFIDNVDYDSAEKIADLIASNRESILSGIQERLELDGNSIQKQGRLVQRLFLLWMKLLEYTGLLVSGRLGERLRQRKRIKAHEKRKLVGIHKSEIESVILGLERIDPVYGNLVCESLAPNVFRMVLPEQPDGRRKAGANKDHIQEMTSLRAK